MHKSAIIILFVGSLVMLLPFGTSTNVMAFEEYEYEADKYDQYVMDMANENYDKSQDSDFIKKIKCNNINANLNGIEANIDTDDSLGGIVGAESIQGDDASANAYGNGEYRNNNGNFDIDCINNNDNEGIGPAGPQGPQGPQGQSFADITMYQVSGPLNTTANTGGAISRALCDPGDIAFNGGVIYI